MQEQALQTGYAYLTWQKKPRFSCWLKILSLGFAVIFSLILWYKSHTFQGVHPPGVITYNINADDTVSLVPLKNDEINQY